jgi:hypothetical protein
MTTNKDKLFRFFDVSCLCAWIFGISGLMVSLTADTVNETSVMWFSISTALGFIYFLSND